MALAYATGTINIAYTSQANKPAGGYRLYYNPTGAGTVTFAEPSVYVPPGPGQDKNVSDNTTTQTLSITLPYLLPQFQSAGASVNITCAICPVDSKGNTGQLSATFTITATVPTFLAAFTPSYAP